MSALPPDGLTDEQAAAILARALYLLDEWEECGLTDRPDSAPLPRGALTIGDATLFASTLVVLILHRFPRLHDEGYTDALLGAAVPSSSGAN
jgi:DNA-binding transcriptional LysR family regulator